MTYEELIQKYPIGKVLHEKVIENEDILPYYSEKDISAYRAKYDRVEVLNSKEVKTYLTHNFSDVVEGYIFDGTEWYPAYDTWDGWVPYRKEDLKLWESGF